MSDQEPLNVQHVSNHTSDICTLVNILPDNTYKMHLHDTSYNTMSEPSSSFQSTRLLSTISESNDAISSPVWENKPGSSFSTRSCDVLQDIFTQNFQTSVHISVFSEDVHVLTCNGYAWAIINQYGLKKALLHIIALCMITTHIPYPIILITLGAVALVQILNLSKI